MKITKTLTTALVFSVFTLSAGLIIAGNSPVRGGSAPCAGMTAGGAPCPMTGTPGAAMDTDGNGTIDEQEFNAMREKRQAAAPTFAEIDADGDGVVTGEELVAMHQQRMGQQGKMRGHHGMGGAMMGNRAGCPGQQQAMDPETREKYDAFMDATAELRKELAAKRAAKRAVMRSANPDPDQAAQLTRELLELRAQIMAQAEEADVDFGPGTGCMNGRTGCGSKGRGGCSGGLR